MVTTRKSASARKIMLTPKRMLTAEPTSGAANQPTFPTVVWMPKMKPRRLAGTSAEICAWSSGSMPPRKKVAITISTMNQTSDGAKATGNEKTDATSRSTVTMSILE
jgi:hypothetical protein